MNKYRGKYKKCRECIHVDEVLMLMVTVKHTCPKKIMFSSGYMVDKYICESCKAFETKEDKHD